MRPEELNSMDQYSPGLATGLAWTEIGGDALYIEANGH